MNISVNTFEKKVTELCCKVFYVYTRMVFIAIFH